MPFSLVLFRLFFFPFSLHRLPMYLFYFFFGKNVVNANRPHTSIHSHMEMALHELSCDKQQRNCQRTNEQPKKANKKMNWALWCSHMFTSQRIESNISDQYLYSTNKWCQALISSHIKYELWTEARGNPNLKSKTGGKKKTTESHFWLNERKCFGFFGWKI